MKFTKLTSIIFASLLVLQGCGGGSDDNGPTPDPQSIVDVAVANDNLTTLVAALEAAGLDGILSDLDNEYTVFAPTDDAFELLGQETLDELEENLDKLKELLSYHVIDGKVDSSAAISSAGSTVAMVTGDSVGLSLDGDKLLINTATVTLYILG